MDSQDIKVGEVMKKPTVEQRLEVEEEQSQESAERQGSMECDISESAVTSHLADVNMLDRELTLETGVSEVADGQTPKESEESSLLSNDHPLPDELDSEHGFIFDKCSEAAVNMSSIGSAVQASDLASQEGTDLAASSPCTSDVGLSECKSALPSSAQGERDSMADVTEEGAHAPLSESVPTYYFVKWINWKGERTPIITQSENGPCPLLAIMNVLFLRWKAKLPPQTEVITTEELMAHLGECILSIKPGENAEGLELNFQQNMSDAMAVLSKLSTGLDVNVRFTGVSDFEYTPECIVFDLLNIPLYHGWLVDPQSQDTVKAVGKLSYNQLVEKIILYKHSADNNQVSEGLVAEQFLESTASQLSYHGLCEVSTTAKEGELSVFFRNNHFSTMIKHKDHLYLLVTDQGFLQEENLVWESLHNVEGDGNFCNSEFRLNHPPDTLALQPQPVTAQGQAAVKQQEQQRQIDQDYMVAMSLQQQQQQGPNALSDLELARQLQQEEYQQHHQQQPLPPQQMQRGQQAARQGPERKQKKEDSDCVIL
ncbi:ubiquitin carboxyl-terminal hydrolase MINDY-1 [Polypterus senegalus]|uniref:ubiquitin carboxyl-terminal hydrolase MINDY-1 n=1 Tax=Polypterus senegalus TaxID=55291 RepID=UPI0019656EBE|nr:ubiquitin carboxyl-terminal hydrolase MINDY-1 [Polypterus senegalus]XP_039606338.1 ubiquitin carboxyl-terminal hydrolase MINDY-1 [Polypterus senegalus]